MAGPIHYEVYLRKTPAASWALHIATENRKKAVEEAEELMADRRACAVKVTKETLDPQTMGFNTVTIFSQGAPEPVRKAKPAADKPQPACSGPHDLYTPHARELIGRVLEDWLRRNGVTAYELLHRPDLAERLEASGMEMQHAIQKVAVPESQALGQPVHEVVRHYQRLTEKAVEHLMTAGRRNRFAPVTSATIVASAEKLEGVEDRAFLMGGSIALSLKSMASARDRLAHLMDIIDVVPDEGPVRALILGQVQAILTEMLSSRASLSEILGPGLDHGGAMAAMVRMIAPREIEILIAHDERMALLMPAIDGAAARLGVWIEQGHFTVLASTLARRILRELRGPRRLRPSDAAGEIDVLRTLAMSLTATAGRLTRLEEVQDAFVERSRTLVTADFVGAYVKGCPTVLDEVQALTRLCENVTGGANKRAAARWLEGGLTSLRFENEMRASGQNPALKMAQLAALQRSLRSAGLSQRDEADMCETVGRVGDAVEAASNLIAQIMRANAAPLQKLTMLMKMATGDAAPVGPVTERARRELLNLARQPQMRSVLAEDPAALQVLRRLSAA